MTRIRIAPDGTVRGLWTDTIDWRSLGRLAVQRASHVEFCRRKQRWYVRVDRPQSAQRRFLRYVLHRPFDEFLYWATSREEALAWEAKHFGPGGAGWTG